MGPSFYNLILPIIIIFLLMLVIAAAAGFFFFFRGEKNPSPTKSPQTVAHQVGKHTSPRAMMTLSWLTGSYAVQHLPITIGRESDNDIVIDDATVSRRHARVYYDNEEETYCIEDLNSDNGMIINGRPSRRNTLLDRYQIRLGETTIKVSGLTPRNPASVVEKEKA